MLSVCAGCASVTFLKRYLYMSLYKCAWFDLDFIFFFVYVVYDDFILVHVHVNQSCRSLQFL